jgi:CRP-like cAMP-binding protein
MIIVEGSRDPGQNRINMTQVIKSVDCPSEKFKSGQLIFEENSESLCFYIIKQGDVDVYKNYGKPNQVRLATIPAGRVLGEISGIDGLPRSATAVAKTDVEVVKVSSSTLSWQMKQCPGWFSAIILDIVERLRATDDLLARNGISGHHSVSSLKATAE